MDKVLEDKIFDLFKREWIVATSETVDRDNVRIDEDGEIVFPDSPEWCSVKASWGMDAEGDLCVYVIHDHVE